MQKNVLFARFSSFLGTLVGLIGGLLAVACSQTSPQPKVVKGLEAGFQLLRSCESILPVVNDASDAPDAPDSYIFVPKAKLNLNDPEKRVYIMDYLKDDSLLRANDVALCLYNGLNRSADALNAFQILSTDARDEEQQAGKKESFAYTNYSYLHSVPFLSPKQKPEPANSRELGYLSMKSAVTELKYQGEMISFVWTLAYGGTESIQLHVMKTEVIGIRGIYTATAPFAAALQNPWLNFTAGELKTLPMVFRVDNREKLASLEFQFILDGRSYSIPLLNP